MSCGTFNPSFANNTKYGTTIHQSTVLIQYSKSMVELSTRASVQLRDADTTLLMENQTYQLGRPVQTAAQ